MGLYEGLLGLERINFWLNFAEDKNPDVRAYVHDFRSDCVRKMRLTERDNRFAEILDSVLTEYFDSS